MFLHKPKLLCFYEHPDPKVLLDLVTQNLGWKKRMLPSQWAV